MGLKLDSLKSLCELIVDCPHSTPKWTDEGVIVLRNQNIRNGVLDLSSPSYTNETDYQKRIKRAIPQAGDIVFTREAPMGEVCLIPEGLKCCLGQRQVLLRPKKGISGEYLFWALQSPYVQHQISWNEGTGTTVSNVRIPVLKALKIPRHPEDEFAVARYISTIARKIQLNRQTNKTLEQMAQALFKSWFVDFDPVIDNALAAGNPIPDALQARAQRRQQQLAKPDHKLLPEDISELFPCEFEHAEALGWVPKGWIIQPLSKLAKLTTNSAHPGKEPEKRWLHYSLPSFDAGRLPAYEKGEEIKSGKYKLPNFSVLVSKLNPHTPRVWLPGNTELGSSVCSTEFMLFVPMHDEWRPYLYALMSSDSMKNELCNRVTGTTGSHQRVRPKEIAEISILMPSAELLTIFSKKSNVFFSKVQQGTEDYVNLARLRDTLLPRLISGQLRIPDVKKEVSDAVA